MTTWYVHRRDDGIIASVHGDPMEGYAEEAMEDTDPEFPKWAKPQAPTPPTPAQKLAAAGLTVDELKTLLGLA